MNALGVGVAMFNCRKQIAIGRPGVNTGEHGLGTLEDFVVQADANWRQLDAAVDGAGLSRRRLMDIVDGDLTDAHTQHIAHQFHNATIRAGTDQGQTQRQLARPRLGNGQLEQHLSSDALEENTSAKAACPAARSVIVAVPANARMARLIRSASGNLAAGQADGFMCDDDSGEGQQYRSTETFPASYVIHD